MNRQVLLLLPEYAPDSTPALAAPQYAEVIDDADPNVVSVRVLLDDDAWEEEETKSDADTQVLRVPRPVANRSRVWAGELANGMPGRLLRRPVVAFVNGQPVHGQVVSYDGRLVTVSHSGGHASIVLDQVEEVAPVVVFLLFKARLQRRWTTRTGVVAAHDKILDRLLGQNGERATTAIGTILAGLVSAQVQPTPTDTLSWVCPSTGTVKVCSVGHVVNYGHYIDGNQTLPPGIALGESFCDDPTCEPHAVPISAATTAPSVRFADLLATLDEHDVDEADSPIDLTRSEQAHPPIPIAESVKHNRDESASADDNTAAVRIMTVLAAQPELLQLYAHQLAQLSSSQKKPRLDSVSDYVPAGGLAGDHSGRAHSGVRFSPTEQGIHGMITAEVHRGKSPVVFIEHIRASRATKFIPLPVILVLLYHFEFGPCRLSILHFKRFDLSMQLEHANNTAVNIRHYSAKAELPKLPATPSHADLISALGILGSYAEEFFDEHTRRLVTSARDFAEELNDFGPWSATEVLAISFWFSNVFRAYRLATEQDFTYGSSTRVNIRARFTMQDSELSGLLFKLSRGRTHNDTQPPAASQVTRHDRSTNPVTHRHPRQVPSTPGAASRRGVSVPQEVARAAPRQNGRQLCLRFISARGCPSGAPERCTHGFLGHFAPSAPLPQIVRGYVEQNLGGLRQDLQNL